MEMVWLHRIGLFGCFTLSFLLICASRSRATPLLTPEQSAFEAAFQGQCEDVSNPCEHVCKNHSPRTYECSCRDGYQLDHNGYSCSDEMPADEARQLTRPTAPVTPSASFPVLQPSDSLQSASGAGSVSQPQHSAPCASILCVGGGVCAVDRVHGYRCLCPLGRTGQHCQEHVVIRTPRFTGDSYAVLPLSTDWDYSLDIRLELRAATENGLILYSGETLVADRNYVLLELVEGYVTFRLRIQKSTVSLQSRYKVPLGDIVPLHVGRHKGLFFIRVASENKIATVVQELTVERLKATENIYLGGLPDMDSLSADVVASPTGFVGCILSLQANGKNFPLEPLPFGSIISGINLDRCDSDACETVQCLNDGECIVDDTKAAKCDCVVPYVGSNCEIDLETQLPMFNGSSYLLYDLPANGSYAEWTEFSVTFKAASVEEGVLLHVGRRQASAFSDALQLRLVGGHVEVAVDLGEGYSSARTQTRLETELWYTVGVLRSGRYLELILEGAGTDRQEIMYHGAFSELTLPAHSGLYVGGVDYGDVAAADAQPSFRGCIDLHQTEFMGMKLKLSKALSAVNLDTCRST